MSSRTRDRAPASPQSPPPATLPGRGREHFRWITSRLPFAFRLALRRHLHAMLGSPMPPLPLPASRLHSLRAGTISGPGVNLLGYARGEFGVAENLRAYARCLEYRKAPFDIFNLDVGSASGQQDHALDAHFANTLPYGTNLFFLNADQMPIARSVLGRVAFAEHLNIGYWAWELERFPQDWRCAFKLVDEVWAPSEFVRRAIGAATRKPVLRMPVPIEFTPPVNLGRAYFGLPDDEFIFLFSYDFNGFVGRKNPEAVIAAFRRAFGDGASGVRLLIKSSNGRRFPAALAGLQQAVADDPRIALRDETLAREEMFGLQNASDCFVSLHRAEGFGLGLAECMYLGKPVIATAYSGNLDFMRADNSLLVDYALIPVRAGEYPYWRGQRWADADVAHAARLMRQVFEDRAFAKSVGNSAAASMRREHSRAVCASAVVERLQTLGRLRPAAPSSTSAVRQ